MWHWQNTNIGHWHVTLTEYPHCTLTVMWHCLCHMTLTCDLTIWFSLSSRTRSDAITRSRCLTYIFITRRLFTRIHIRCTSKFYTHTCTHTHRYSYTSRVNQLYSVVNGIAVLIYVTEDHMWQDPQYVTGDHMRQDPQHVTGPTIWQETTCDRTHNMWQDPQYDRRPHVTGPTTCDRTHNMTGDHMWQDPQHVTRSGEYFDIFSHFIRSCKKYSASVWNCNHCIKQKNKKNFFFVSIQPGLNLLPSIYSPGQDAHKRIHLEQIHAKAVRRPF